jgi:hypothetical protein
VKNQHSNRHADDDVRRMTVIIETSKRIGDGLARLGNYRLPQ